MIYTTPSTQDLEYVTGTVEFVSLDTFRVHIRALMLQHCLGNLVLYSYSGIVNTWSTRGVRIIDHGVHV